MYRYFFVALSLTLAFFSLGGCDSGKSGSSQEGSQAQKEEHSHGEEGHSHGEEGHSHGDQEKSATVDVPEKGKEFEPAITTDQLPDGAWHCNMKGSVHYAAMTKGNGECPVCGMDLEK